MIDIFASQIGFTLMLFLFAAGALGALLLQRHDRLANWWGNCFAIVGSAMGIVFAATTLGSDREVSFTLGSFVTPLFSLIFTVDKLSAFFTLVISIIALCCSVYGLGYVSHFYKKYNIGALGFFYNSFIAGMLLVVAVSNALL